MSVVKGPSALERLIASAHVFRAREAFNAGRNACVAYARAAYKHRGEPVLLLLADDMSEIEMEGTWPVPPDVERDLELLARIRAADGLQALQELLEGDHENEELPPEYRRLVGDALALLSPGGQTGVGDSAADSGNPAEQA